MQHFSVSHFTAKMTRTQKSQKLRKTMIHFFFLIPHLPVLVSCESLSFLFSHRYKNCYFFFALKFLLCLCSNEKLHITMGSHYTSHHLTWALTSVGSPEASFWFSQSPFTQQEKGPNETAIHLLTHQTGTCEILSDWDLKVKENRLPCHSVAERKVHDYSGVYLGK